MVSGVLERALASPLLLPPGYVARDSATRPLVTQWSTYGFGVPQPTTFSDYVKLEETHAVVAKCVRLNGRAVAQGRLRLYRRGSAPRAGESDEAALSRQTEEVLIERHPIADLLEDVNKEMSSFDLIQYTVMSLDLTGNAYWELVRGRAVAGQKAWLCGVEVEVLEDADQMHGRDALVRLPRGAVLRAPAPMLRTPVTEIWPLNPGRMTIEPSATGPTRYWFDVNGGRLLMHPEQIIHFRDIAVGNDFYGIGPLLSNVQTLVSDQLQDKADKSLLQNAARPSGIMTYDAESSEDAIRAAVEMFSAAYSGSENAGKVLHVAGGRKFEPLSMNPIQLQSMERSRWNKSMIQQALDVYPIVYGLDPGDTSATRENSEQQIKLYVTFGVMPRAEKIERVLNEQGLHRMGFGDTEQLYVRFDFSSSPLVRMLLAEEASRLTPLLSAGTVLPNEQRLLLAGQRPSFSPVEWGDTWWGNPMGATPIAGEGAPSLEEQAAAAQGGPAMGPPGGPPFGAPPSGPPPALDPQRLGADGLAAVARIVRDVSSGAIQPDAGIVQLTMVVGLSPAVASLAIGSTGMERAVCAENLLSRAFDESQHERDESGKFTSGGGGSGSGEPKGGDADKRGTGGGDKERRGSRADMSSPPSKSSAVAEVEAEFGGATNPDGADSLERYRGSQRRRELHDAIVGKRVAALVSQAEPVYVMMGGGPASGKSSMIKSGAVRLPDNHMLADADAIKEELPEFRRLIDAGDARGANYVHEESSMLAKRAVAEAMGKRANVVLDGTGDSGVDSIAKKSAEARARGLKVKAEYATCNVDEAQRRNVERARKTGRLVPESLLRKVHADIPKTVKASIERGLFDEFNLWDTENSAGGKPKRIASANGTKLEIHDRAAWERFLARGEGKP